MITGKNHTSFAVSNLEDTLHFFCDILGMEASPVMKSRGELLENLLQMPGASIKFCFVTVPDGSKIEFIEYLAPEGDKIDLKTCNIGVAHVAFEVDDIQQMYDDLTAKGVEFNCPPIWVEAGGLKGWGIGYLKGPDGITMEFMQPPR
jgi:lactoylglutathione lyase